MQHRRGDSVKRRRRKRSGYPLEHLNDKRESLKTLAQLFAFVGAITTLFYIGGLYDIGFMALAALSGAVGICLLWSFVVTAFAKPLLALYFENEVSGDWVWSKVLARRCTDLDALASETSRLSSFGFADDMNGETVIWHTPERGIETVEQLLQKLRNEPQLLQESAVIIADLENMRARLHKACETGTRFSLIFHYAVVSGAEIDQRKGHF